MQLAQPSIDRAKNATLGWPLDHPVYGVNCRATIEGSA
jgi:hypothetical protein